MKNRPLILASLCLSSTLGFAWDNPAHMAVAGLAYDELSPAQKRSLASMLRKHPDLSLVKNGFPDEQILQDDRAFVMAMATWPDLIKQSHDYQNNGYEAQDPAPPSVRFDHEMHKGWHFIDIPLWVGQDPTPHELPAIPRVNAVNIVKVLTTQFQNDDGPGKAFDLGWLLHLVGDLHQPLHAATGVSETLPAGDTGGNDVLLDGDTHAERELHAYWDDALGKTARPDPHTHKPRLDKDLDKASQIVTDLQGLDFGADSENLNPQKWADESYRLAVDDVYNLTLVPTEGDRGEVLKADLDETYHQRVVTDARNRVRLAGHRLARLLQSLLR